MLTSKNCTPPGRKAQQTVIAFRRNRSNPVVHPSLDRVRGDEFSQRGAEEGLKDPDKDEAVDDWDVSIDVLQGDRGVSYERLGLLR